MEATAARTQESSAALAHDLYTVLSYLLSTSTPDFFRALSRLDVSLTQVKLLHVLDKPGADQTLKDMAEELSFSLPTASRAIEALHQRGLVDRREDEHDRRMKRVTITAAGRDLLRRLNEMRIAQLERFADTMSAAERHELRVALAPLVGREEIGAYRP